MLDITSYGFNYNPLVIAADKIDLIKTVPHPEWVQSDVQRILSAHHNVIGKVIDIAPETNIYLHRIMSNYNPDVVHERAFYASQVKTFTLITPNGVFSCNYDAIFRRIAGICHDSELTREILNDALSSADSFTCSQIHIDRENINLLEFNTKDVHNLEGQDDHMQLLAHAFAPRGEFGQYGCVVTMDWHEQCLHFKNGYHPINNPEDVAKNTTMTNLFTIEAIETFAALSEKLEKEFA